VLGPKATLREAEEWFIGQVVRKRHSLVGLVNPKVDEKACRMLERVVYDADCAELLPYILDVHGPGSRASVRRNPGTQKARTAKRQDGVFYTPADVAEYQARVIAYQHGGGTALLRCLDPACGSGVYLRAMLRIMTRLPLPINLTEYVTQCLYGLDVSAQAIEASCFVLLNDCMAEVLTRRVAPWFVWHAIRLNFACRVIVKSCG
jgi:type I restriction-modification system DNA methylase subunit